MKKITLGSLVLVSLLGAAGCGTDEPMTLTYEEFRAQAAYDAETDTYVIDGDQLVENEAQMRQMYERFLASVNAVESGLRTVQQGLIVNTVGGADDKWNASQAANLTYCVSSKSFGSNYAAVVAAMNAATADWESSARVNFVHSSSLDGNCSSRSNVVFNIRSVRTSQYLARAFFPSTSRRGREILISTSSFGNINPWTLTGILRHELGHTIGFRHEHTRPESGVCFEDNNWRALTTYDSASVMHYPQCNGTQNGDLTLTARDRAGAAALYP
ncbi:MAG: M57 family metalloprotease [Kofleriaceae bacterium]